ncbi:hypothetical protein Bpfe_012545, partial [Biomphalaria pfeifferi]
QTSLGVTSSDAGHALLYKGKQRHLRSLQELNVSELILKEYTDFVEYFSTWITFCANTTDRSSAIIHQ